MAAKTRQKHDYPSGEHRRSYARRTGAERTFSTAKDPASNNIARGWTRLIGLAPDMLWLACLLAVRNQRILTAWAARQDDNARRAAAGLPPKPGAAAARPPPSLAATRRPAMTPQRHQVPPATRARPKSRAARHARAEPALPRPAATAATPVHGKAPSPSTRATGKCQTQT